jgi:adenylate cyclase
VVFTFHADNAEDSCRHPQAFPEEEALAGRWHPLRTCPTFGRSRAGPKQAVEQASVGARSAAAKPAGISLAVLPFVNLSSDKEQEFFSDGMTEEITAALAKVPDLKVVARTSAFEFKGKNVGVDKIGQQLHATHLIEGSVRKAGDKPRHHGPTYQGR